MTKQEKKAYNKAYRVANKEKEEAYNKAYRASNKEKAAAYHKAYREANKEKVLAYDKAYYQANREKRRAQSAAQTAANKHEHVVYYLPEHHYVGVTNCLYNRLNNHRSFHNRVTEGYEIIYTAKYAVEARAVERYMHYEMGYNGQHRGTKGY